MLQAIGSEVAAETNRSAVTNAPAKQVAISRVEAKLANIVEPLFILSDPTIGPTPYPMHGLCQFKNVIYFQ
jgi:hypothetical protein